MLGIMSSSILPNAVTLSRLEMASLLWGVLVRGWRWAFFACQLGQPITGTHAPSSSARSPGLLSDFHSAPGPCRVSQTAEHFPDNGHSAGT